MTRRRSSLIALLAFLLHAVLLNGCGGSGETPTGQAGPEEEVASPENGTNESSPAPAESAEPTAEDDQATAKGHSPQIVFDTFRTSLAEQEWAEAARLLTDDARRRWTLELLDHARVLAEEGDDVLAARDSLSTLADEHGVHLATMPELYLQVDHVRSKTLAGVDDEVSLAAGLLEWIDEHPADSVPSLDWSSRWQGTLQLPAVTGDLVIGRYVAPQLGPDTTKLVTFRRSDEHGWRFDPSTSGFPDWLPKPTFPDVAQEEIEVDLATPAAASESYRRSQAARDWRVALSCLDEPSLDEVLKRYMARVKYTGDVPRPDVDAAVNWTTLRSIDAGESDFEKMLAEVEDRVGFGATLAAWLAEHTDPGGQFERESGKWRLAEVGEPVIDEGRAVVPVVTAPEEYGSLTGLFFDERLVLRETNGDWRISLLESAGATYGPRVVDPPHRRLLRTIPVKTGVVGMTFSPDGKTLYGCPGGPAAWNVESGELLWETQREGHALAVSPDGGRLAMGSGFFQEGEVRILDAATGEVLQEVGKHEGSVWFVAFLDEDTLISGAWDGTARVWKLGETPEEIRRIEFGEDASPRFALSPDHEVLASRDGADPIVVWDVGTGERLGAVEGQAMAFLEDGSLYVADQPPRGHRYDSFGGRDPMIFSLWDRAQREIADESVMLRVGDVGYDLLASPDGRRLYFHHWHDVVVWDSEEDRVVDRLTGHARAMQSLALSPDGSVLATGPVGGPLRETDEPVPPAHIHLWRVGGSD